MAIVAPYLPYESLRLLAADFLTRHHQVGDLPVPIEWIVENNFSLDIVPVPGLKDGFDVEAFITKDLTEIRIDETIYQKRPNRYRFSLAHEVAHLELHRDVYTTLNFCDIAEWKKAMTSIPADQYSWIETQAYNFAGLVLVPPTPLNDIFSDHVERMKKAGVEFDELSASAKKTVFSSIGRAFEVSSEVVEKRIKKDGLLTA